MLPAACVQAGRAGASEGCHQGQRSACTRLPPSAPPLTRRINSPAQGLSIDSAPSARSQHSWRSLFAPVSCSPHLLLEFEPMKLESVCARSLIDHHPPPLRAKIEGPTVGSNQVQTDRNLAPCLRMARDCVRRPSSFLSYGRSRSRCTLPAEARRAASDI